MPRFSSFLCFVVLMHAAVAVMPANAGEVDVLDVKVRKTASGTYAFDVTVKHADTGWQHYANKWEVVAPDGSVLGTRVLHHPHVDEQPFTRSLSGIKIPAQVKTVTIRAFDSKHGDGGATKSVELPK